MFSLRNYVMAVVVASAFLGGCDPGMQPTGPTPGQIQAKMATLPPDQQISMIEHSPMPKDQKAQKIQEIRTKFNLTATSSSSDSPSGTAANKGP